jgi:heptose I phosphotransferase
VQIVSDWEPWLRGAGLTTLAAFRALRGEVVRVIDSRETLRVEIPHASDPTVGPLVAYLKRHGRPRWRERIVPWLRGARPILGAAAEWQALGHFAACGIPTMQPIAYGADADGSFVMTVDLAARCDLKAWVGACRGGERSPACKVGEQSDLEDGHSTEQALDDTDGEPGWSATHRKQLGRIVARLAEMVRRLHAAGMHHQDLYLNHVLWCGPEDAAVPDLRLIDLGRVVRHARLCRRWRIKDLAQLHYSAAGIPCREQVRFLQLYLGRKLTRCDRPLIRRILRKSARIDRHTRRHGL